jgi:para-nitrobenzyl esterase
VAELLPLSQGMEPSGAPAVGGGVLPLNIREAISFDRFNHVPVMQGATADEALYYVVPFFDGAGKPVTAAQYPSLLRAFFGDSAGKVEEKYPLSAYRTPALAFSRAIGDSGAVYASRIGACNTLLGNRMLAAKVPLYAFEFSDPDAPFPAPMFPFANGGITGPGHTSELTYLWDNDLALTSAQRRLSDIMIGYWSNFVASGDPNGPGLAPWPSFTPRRAAVQELANGSASSSLGYSADHNCAFWNELGYGNLYGWAGQRSPMPWEISQEQAHATDHAEPH